MTLKKCGLVVLLLVLASVLSLAACGSDTPQGYDPNSVSRDGGRDGTVDGGNQTICLLNNCTLDRDCADCAQGRTTCLQAEHRCIACQPGSTGTCGPGKYCTKYGDCVANGTQCQEDPTGNPQISCNADADCAACNPKHRVCDAGQHKCVGCIPSVNTTNCQSTDACVNEVCVAKCPASCTTDNDCAQCGAPGHEAHACNNHKCAACSPTVACGAGACDVAHGVCQPSCGVPGRPQECNVNMDCGACKGNATSCDSPVNGGLGTCAKPANGCSDLGKGVLVLPPPFDGVTNTCSTDADCSSVNANVNVGKALRDLTGISGIGDGDLLYPMHACASVKIINHVSCGVCVPCKQDSDCSDIDLTKLTNDVLGPIGTIAERLLADQIFGPNDNKIHMYCDPIVDGYGACVPCADFLHACGSNQPQPPASTNCTHDLCTTGDALGTSCNQCTADVCKEDPFCCDAKNGAWDDACKTEVDVYCKTATCAPPDSCYGKQANTWYCSEDITGGAFHCDDQVHVDKANTCSVDAGQQYCHKQGTGHAPLPSDNAPKDPAVLDGSGTPTCFGSP